jgi:hypothetical protein
MPSKTTDGSDVPLVQPDLPVRRAIPERQLNNNRGRLDRGGPFHSKKNPPAAAGTRHMRATRVATLELKNLRGNTMADDDLQDLTNAQDSRRDAPQLGQGHRGWLQTRRD